MYNEARKKFTSLLKKYNIREEFTKKLKILGVGYDRYCIDVEALYAFRRIWNYYDDSPLAKVANEWEDTVVINRFSSIISAHINKWGIPKTIAHIHALQQMGRWDVPKGLDGMYTEIDAREQAKMEMNNIYPDVNTFALVDINLNYKNPSLTLDDSHIRVWNNPKSNYYRVTLNKYISDIVKWSSLYLSIRKDMVSGHNFLIFKETEEPGSIICRKYGRWNYRVYSKPLVDYLSQEYGKHETEFLLAVSKNISKDKTYIMLEIIGD